MNCPSCGFSNISEVYHAKEFCLQKCHDCGLVSKKTGDLSRGRVQKIQDSVYTDLEARTANRMFKKMARDRLKILRRFKNRGKLLEIGCATGEFVEEADKAGFDATGIDSSRIYSSYAAGLGLDVRCGRLEDFDFPRESFDVIAMFHLLEHIEEPGRFLWETKSYLTPGGLIYIIVPNLDSFTDRFFGFRHTIFTQPGHLFFYSSRSASGLLEKQDFQVVGVTFLEYLHEPFTSAVNSLPGIIRKMLGKEKRSGPAVPPPGGENACQPGKRRSRLKGFLVNKAPYLLGYIFSPLLKPYGLILEGTGRGSELV